MIRARALVVEVAGGGARLATVDVEEPHDGEVLVRLVASGVCSTDEHVATGSSRPPVMPVVLGHEGAGIVEAVGAGVTSLAPGDHVVFARTAPCGACRQCVRGFGWDCDADAYRRGLLGITADGDTRVRLDGRQAYPLYGGTLCERTTVRAEHLVRIDDDLPLELMSLAGCAVVTGVGAVANVAQVSVGSSVLVVGCGGVGLSVVQAARIVGATTIVAADVARASLDLATTLGATHTIHVEPGKPLSPAVRTILADGVDVAFEVVGIPELVSECVQSTRIGGTTVMVGVPAPDAVIPLPAMAIIHDRRLIGCRGGSSLPQRDIPRIADLVRTGLLRLEPLVGRFVALDDVQSALEGLRNGALGRTVVRFDPHSTL